MTLDPVHLDGIASLARQIRREVDEDEHRDDAERVWESYLDPLVVDGDPVLEPLDGKRRYSAPLEELGLQDDAFETVCGLDSGTINPRTFRNGLVLDVAQAAMSASPSDLDLHRSRTTIVSVHSNDVRVAPGGEGWTYFDDGYGQGRVVHVEGLARDQERVVHGLSLYLAESHHALRHADGVEDCLLLDGPLYPKAILRWLDRGDVLADLVTDEPLVGEVLANYVGLVEAFAAQGVPLVGFVKNPEAGALIRALNDRERPPPTPWADDAAFFAQVLERRADGERRRDVLTWTGWFRSRLGADRAFADGDLGVERSLPPSAYEVTFFVVYDPRTDLAYRVELPGAFAADEAVRERVRRQVLRDVAGAEGPPPAVGKADALARIGAAEKQSLVERLERAFESRVDRSYDDERWSVDG